MNLEFNQRVNLPVLNLPFFEPKLQETDGSLFIFDPLRKKHLVLTPEEWVRQHWVNFLINHHNYPRGLFSMEKGLKYNLLSKRTDLVVFDRKSNPYLLVECKAPSVKINENTLSQIMTYNKELNSPNLVLSNGLHHLFVRFSEVEGRFVQESTLPLHPL